MHPHQTNHNEIHFSIIISTQQHKKNWLFICSQFLAQLIHVILFSIFTHLNTITYTLMHLFLKQLHIKNVHLFSYPVCPPFLMHQTYFLLPQYFLFLSVTRSHLNIRQIIFTASLCHNGVSFLSRVDVHKACFPSYLLILLLHVCTPRAIH